MSLAINVEGNNLLGLNTSSLFGIIMLVLFVEKQKDDLGEVIIQGISNLHDSITSLNYAEAMLYRTNYTSDYFDNWYTEIESLFYGPINNDSQRLLNQPFLNYPHFPTDQLIRYYYDAILSFQQEVRPYIDLIDWHFKPVIMIDDKTYEALIQFRTR